MTKIPLGFPKYFQLWYNSFFIMYKLIALGIIGFGQVLKKTKTQIDPRPWTRPVSKGHDSCPQLSTALLLQFLQYPKLCSISSSLLAIFPTTHIRT